RAIEEGAEVKIESIEALNRECDEVMQSEDSAVHFRGEPFTESEWKELEPLFELSGEILARLDWLIPDEGTSAESPADDRKTPEGASTASDSGFGTSVDRSCGVAPA